MELIEKVFTGATIYIFIGLAVIGMLHEVLEFITMC